MYALYLICQKKGVAVYNSNLTQAIIRIKCINFSAIHAVETPRCLTCDAKLLFPIARGTQINGHKIVTLRNHNRRFSNRLMGRIGEGLN